MPEDVADYIRREIKPANQEYFRYQLSELAKSQPDHPVSMFSRAWLTSKERVITETVESAGWIYFLSHTLMYLQKNANPEFFRQIERVFEPISHFTSVGGTTFAVGLSVMASEKLAIFAEKNNQPKFASFSRKVLPIGGAVAAASYHFAVESGYFPPILGAPNTLDAFYGIAAIAPAYLAFRGFTDIGRRPGYGFAVWGDFKDKIVDLGQKVRANGIKIKGIQRIEK